MSSSAYFVPDLDLVVRDRPIPYSLYINSSVIEGREHFVRIFPKGEVLNEPELTVLKERYQQLYISENDRAEYLKGACRNLGKTEDEKIALLKNSAIQHLQTLFSSKKDLSVEIINQTLSGCRQTVEGFVDLLKGYDLNNIHELIGNLSFHDFYTYDHSINVSMYSILIYQLLRPEATEDDIVNAGMGGFLHDIGKIKISNRIINKVGKLTDEEFAIIKEHPQFGFDFLSLPGVKGPPGSDVNLIRDVVYQHHENFDGTGYPNKKKAEEIQFLARITSVADFFDAVTTKRSYAEALSVEEALDLMKKTRGKKLDPLIFDRFLGHMREKYVEKHCDLVVPSDFDPCQPHLKLRRTG